MDSRGIPIVLPGNKYASSPKRTPKRKSTVKNDIPTSPFNVRNNEPSLLEIYDSFADACFQSHYNHSMLNDDYRYNIQDFYKTDMCPSDNFQSSLVPSSTPKRHRLNDSEISSSRVPDLQASRNSMFTYSQQSQQSEDVNYEYMEEEADSLLNHLGVAEPTAQTISSVVQTVMPMRETVIPDLPENNYSTSSSTVDILPMNISEQAQTNNNEIEAQDFSKATQQIDDDDDLPLIDVEEPMPQEENHDFSNMDIIEDFELHLPMIEESKSSSKDEQPTLENVEANEDIQYDSSSKLPLKASQSGECVLKSVDVVVSPLENNEPEVSRDCTVAEESNQLQESITTTTEISATESQRIDINELSICSSNQNDVETLADTPADVTPIDSPAKITVETPVVAPIENSQTLTEIPMEKPAETPMEIPATPVRRSGRPSKKSTPKESIAAAPATPPRRSTRGQKNVEIPNIPLPTTTRRSTRSKTAAPQPEAHEAPEAPRRMTRSRAKSIDQSSPVQIVKQSPKKSPKKQTKKIAVESIKEEVEPVKENNDSLETNADIVVDKKSDRAVTVEEGEKTEMDRFEKMRRDRDKEEIDKINKEFPSLKNYYELVERAGRGTFSKVYKAKDLLIDHYMPIDEKYKLDSTDENYVAVKVIFDISSPKRVADEIEYLTMFRSFPCITPLITAFRHEANTYVVLPYIEFDHFDDFYSSMTLSDVRSYISQLLTGLEGVHIHNIMHRDVKPGNFLYNNKTKVGYLADFGLAQKMNTYYPRGNLPNAQYTQHQSEAGFYMHDRRLNFFANRSGTKGFRAPEIMLKFTNQTTAIDIWAVGVILLIILGGKYPFFNPDDDADGIMEIAHLFGSKELKAFTEYYGRRLLTNIPSIPEEGRDLAELCRTINKDRVDAWDPEEFLLAVDLMKNCLQLIHTKRLTATEALNHPFLQQQ